MNIFLGLFRFLSLFVHLLELFLSLLQFFSLLQNSLFNHFVDIDVFICPVMNASDENKSDNIGKNSVEN